MNSELFGSETGHAYLLVLDGTDHTHRLAQRLLDGGHRFGVVSASAHDVVEFAAAQWHGRVWPIVADPSDPAQMDDVLARVTGRLGPISMVIDPSGLVADIARADARLTA